MTVQGSPRTRFKRALAARDPLLAKAALAELPRIGLEDGLAVLLVHCGHPDFERMAMRFHAKLCREVKLSMPEAQLALAALHSLESGADALARLFERHGLDDAVKALDADWP